MDSRHEVTSPNSDLVSCFWGIVWTAGGQLGRLGLDRRRFLGDSVDSRPQFWSFGTRKSVNLFLGDSVDSRPPLPLSGLPEIGFWGIVWTAGHHQCPAKAQTLQGFWGIVWTAGVLQSIGLSVGPAFLGDSVDSRHASSFQLATWSPVFGG